MPSASGRSHYVDIIQELCGCDMDVMKIVLISHEHSIPAGLASVGMAEGSCVGVWSQALF